MAVDDTALAALRALRAIDLDLAKGDSARRLLAIVAEATSSTFMSLQDPTGEVTVGERGLGAGRHEAVVDLGTAKLALERDRRPYGRDDLQHAELLGGEVVMRLGVARAEAEATRQTRRVELLHALMRADVLERGEVADRAATEMLEIFSGGVVALHVLAGDTLELVTRRTLTGETDAPDWFQRISIDTPSTMATAVRERRIVHARVRDLQARAQENLDPLGVRYIVAAPLIFGEEVLGTLTVAHGDLPTREAVALIESAAAQVSVGIAHARRLQEARQRADDLRLVHEIGTLVAMHLELPAVLQTAVRELSRVLEVPLVHLMLLDDAGTALTGIACTLEDITAVTLPLDATSAATTAFRTRQFVVIDDALNDPRVSRRLVETLGSRSILALPILSRGEAIGALALVETRRMRRFTDSEVARAAAVANLLAPAISNARMFEDLRRSYAALARAQAEAVRHERLAALGELSAVVAHEVRNPLAVIFNSLPPLRKLMPTDSDATLLLDIVGEEASRLNRIVGNLLDFAKPYAAHARPVEIVGLVRGAVEAAQRATPSARVTVQTDVASAPGDIVVDGTMLQQALINLVVNAIQASPPEGVVIVRVIPTPWDGVRCEVADEGPGIEDTERSRIFQPFVTTKASGTGLGLAVVRRISEALGGNVEVARSTGRSGSVFALTVPTRTA
jgi:signal transduction histidine kinase